MKPLAPRELEVLRLRSTGMPMKAVARHLGVSEMTVKHHTHKALGKLGVGSFVEAMNALGWVRRDELP